MKSLATQSLLLLLLSAAPAAAQTGSAAALDATPAELSLADGDLRIVNLYALQGRVLHESAGLPADSAIDRLTRAVWAPYSEFWAGYLGDEAAFRRWTVDLLEADHPIHARMQPLLDADLPRRFTDAAQWLEEQTGRRPVGTWYVVFGPGWTDMGGLSGIGMVADFSKMLPDSARLARILPHELTHQVHAAAPDRDAGTVLHRVIAEGFASYVAWLHAAGAASPARAIGYSEEEWSWARAHEPRLWQALQPTLASRDRADVDRIASRGEHLIEGDPAAVGYFLGFRIVQAFVAEHGADSWQDLFDLPAAAVLERSGYGRVQSELDAYWAELARTVREGDFDAYAAAYHDDAVLVSLGARRSYPIARALAGWKQGFDDTRAGSMSADVEFRFTQRLHDATTAHETGIFRYVAQQPGAEPQVALVHFQGLLVKKDGRWLMIMEYQQQPATEAEWEAAR